MPLPDELVGKTQEEIYDILSQAHEQEVNEVRKEILEKIPKQKEPDKTQPVVQPVVQQQQQYQQPFVPPQADSFYTDPEALASQKAAEVRRDITQTMALTQRPANEQLFALSLDEEDREIFAKYRAEINARVDSLPIEGQANPKAYELAYQVVTGMHRKEIEKERFEKNAEELVKNTLRDRVGMAEEDIARAFEKNEAPQRRSIFQVPTGVVNAPQPRYQGATKAKSPKLDEVQKKIARGFGMTDEEYLKYSDEE